MKKDSLKKSKKKNRFILKTTVWMFILTLFIGLRIFRLPQSFLFFGDLGRDVFVLQKWAGDIFHPPLLGPQTSVVSFNHSAWYYYYLFPFFLLTGHSVYSTVIAALTLYAAVFIGAFAVFRKRRRWLPAAALFYLIAIHPQFVIQHRYIWNPSLITPFLLVSFWGWWRYQSDKHWRWLAVCAFCLAFATGLNLSLVPTTAVITGLVLWEQRKNKQGFWQFIGLSAAANFLMHLPTLIFELRHNFLLFRNLPAEELQQVEPQLGAKLLQLFENLFLPTRPADWGLGLGAAILFLLLFVYFRSEKLRSSWVFVRALQIFFFTVLLMIFMPIRMHGHFLFGVITFLLVAIARLPKKLLFVVLAVLSVFYFQPYYFRLYQQPAPHTVSEQSTCMQQACEVIKQQNLEPIFINTQTLSYNHQAREYVFLLKELGCQAIETQQFLITPTQYMGVIADQAEFTNGQTGYYELSQFGPAEELQKISCKEDLSVYLLKSDN